MQFTTAAITSILATLAFAAPAPQTTVTPGQTSPWSVTNYYEDCTSDSCSYSFDITTTSDPDFGGYATTSCTGSDEPNTPSNCANTQFSASLTANPGLNAGQTLSVSREFPFGDETDIAGGSVSFELICAEPDPCSYTINAQVYGQISQ